MEAAEAAVARKPAMTDDRSILEFGFALAGVWQLWWKVLGSRVMMSMSLVRMKTWTLETFISQHLPRSLAGVLNLLFLCLTAIHLGSMEGTVATVSAVSTRRVRASYGSYPGIRSSVLPE